MFPYQKSLPQKAIPHFSPESHKNKDCLRPFWLSGPFPEAAARVHRKLLYFYFLLSARYGYRNQEQAYPSKPAPPIRSSGHPGGTHLLLPLQKSLFPRSRRYKDMPSLQPKHQKNPLLFPVSPVPHLYKTPSQWFLPPSFWKQARPHRSYPSAPVPFL